MSDDEDYIIGPDNEIYVTDKEEERQIEFEKEHNPIWKNFRKLKNDNDEIECMLGMLLTALDNEFNLPEITEITDYLFILQDRIKNHSKLLDDFFKLLKTPESKGNLVSLTKIRFKD